MLVITKLMTNTSNKISPLLFFMYYKDHKFYFFLILTNKIVNIRNPWIKLLESLERESLEKGTSIISSSWLNDNKNTCAGVNYVGMLVFLAMQRQVPINLDKAYWLKLEWAQCESQQTKSFQLIGQVDMPYMANAWNLWGPQNKITHAKWKSMLKSKFSPFQFTN